MGNHAVQIRVLGPLAVTVAGRSLPLGGRKQRTVLAALAVRWGRVVSTADLVEAVWGEDEPLRPNAVLQVYVSNLRRLLVPEPEAGSAPRLVFRPPGYLLDVGENDSDLAQFELRALQGQRAARDGRLAEAAALARQALALFEGPLLADLVEVPWFEPDRARLEESRLTLVELRLQLDLQLGREAELVAELEGLVTEHPLRERLWELLIVTLYRCGRQGDALATYQRVRRLLRAELGVDPSPALRDLERFVLAQSAQLAAESSGWALLVWTEPGGHARVLPLDPARPRVAMGRRSDNHLPLPWDVALSRHHAALVLLDGQWHLQDQGSSNGSFVNGERVDTSRPLRHGDVLRLGDTALVFRWPHSAPTTAQSSADLSRSPTRAGG